MPETLELVGVLRDKLTCPRQERGTLGARSRERLALILEKLSAAFTASIGTTVVLELGAARGRDLVAPYFGCGQLFRFGIRFAGAEMGVFVTQETLSELAARGSAAEERAVVLNDDPIELIAASFCVARLLVELKANWGIRAYLTAVARVAPTGLYDEQQTWFYCVSASEGFQVAALVALNPVHLQLLARAAEGSRPTDRVRALLKKVACAAQLSFQLPIASLRELSLLRPGTSFELFRFVEGRGPSTLCGCRGLLEIRDAVGCEARAALGFELSANSTSTQLTCVLGQKRKTSGGNATSQSASS